MAHQPEPARPWQTLGAHLGRADGADGARFAVWAPNATQVGTPSKTNSPLSFVVVDFSSIRQPLLKFFSSRITEARGSRV